MSSKDKIKEQIERQKKEREEKARIEFLRKQEEQEQAQQDDNANVNVNANDNKGYTEWKDSGEKKLIGLYLEPEVIKVLKALNKKKGRGFQSHFANEEIKKGLKREGWL